MAMAMKIEGRNVSRKYSRGKIYVLLINSKYMKVEEV